MKNIGNCNIDADKMKICIPLEAENIEELKEILYKLKEKKFDLIEFRVDHISNIKEIKSSLEIIRENVSKPVIFTCRTDKEGGCFAGDVFIYYELNLWAIESGLIDAIDIEYRFFSEEKKEETAEYRNLIGAEISGMIKSESCQHVSMEIEKIVEQNPNIKDDVKKDVEDIMMRTVGEKLIELASEHNVATIVSKHVYDERMSYDKLIEMLESIYKTGADIPKIAVMAYEKKDVAAMVYASSLFRENHENQPFIAISMGKQGVATRLFGDVFGSSISFMSLNEKKAMGQISIDRYNKFIELDIK